MTDELNKYEVTEARFIAGQHRSIGDPVQMTKRAAKYYVAPHGTGLKLVPVLPAQPVAKSDAKPAEKAPKVES